MCRRGKRFCRPILNATQMEAVLMEGSRKINRCALYNYIRIDATIGKLCAVLKKVVSRNISRDESGPSNEERERKGCVRKFNSRLSLHLCLFTSVKTRNVQHLVTNAWCIGVMERISHIFVQRKDAQVNIILIY